MCGKASRSWQTKIWFSIMIKRSIFLTLFLVGVDKGKELINLLLQLAWNYTNLLQFVMPVSVHFENSWRAFYN